MYYLNLLIIEDNIDDYLLIVRKIEKEGVELTSKRIESPEELEASLSSEDYDAILSDNALPEIDALEALEITRKISKDIPFIIVSGSTGEQRAVQAMRNGANDYIAKDHLDRLIPVLWRELKEAKNRKKQKEAQHDLQTFIYRSSHDLKGPLASIKGLAELIQCAPNMDEVKESMIYLLKSTSRMELAINQLLEMFKMQESKIVVEPVSLEQLVHEVWEDIRHMCDQDDVELLSDLNEMQKIESNPFLLKSIFQNLLENAVKYRGKDRKCVISINTSLVDKRLSVSFKDNGAGIHEELHGKVFDMFFRGDESTKGTGLGLYVTKHAVEKLGGLITLNSIKNEGSTFKIDLPIQNKMELVSYRA